MTEKSADVTSQEEFARDSIASLNEERLDTMPLDTASEFFKLD